MKQRWGYMVNIFKNIKTVDELSCTYDNTKHLLWWMRFNIRDVVDSGNISNPHKTISDRCGSHLEFAWLFCNVLNSRGKDCYIVTVKGHSDSAACFFYDDNSILQCMSNRWTLPRCGDSIESSIDFIDNDWARWIEWVDINGKLVPVKPHYSDGSEIYERSWDACSYLLPGRGLHGLPRVI